MPKAHRYSVFKAYCSLRLGAGGFYRQQIHQGDDAPSVASQDTHTHTLVWRAHLGSLTCSVMHPLSGEAGAQRQGSADRQELAAAAGRHPACWPPAQVSMVGMQLGVGLSCDTGVRDGVGGGRRIANYEIYY